MNYSDTDEAPSAYTTAGILMVVSGFTTMSTSFALFCSLFYLCVGFWWLIPMCLSIFEIVIGIALMQGRARPDANVFVVLGLVNALLAFNLWGVICEAIALSQLQRPEVQGWLLDAR